MDSKTVIDRLGGPSEVARLCGVKPQAVSQWYGVHTKNDKRHGKPRSIPKPWLAYLRSIRPDAFQVDEQEAGV